MPLTQRHKKALDDIESFLDTNPFVVHDKGLVEGLKAELDVARSAARFESDVREVIIEHADAIHQLQTREDRETKTKSYQFGTLLGAIRNYLKYNRVFYASRDRIAKFSINMQYQSSRVHGTPTVHRECIRAHSRQVC